MAKPLRLSALLEAIEEAEGRHSARISKVLHDETGSRLTAVALQLELLRMDGVQGLEPVLAALEHSFDSVRSLSQNINPKIVERIGLPAALQALCSTQRPRFSGTFIANIDAAATGPAQLYRIAEELLDNAIRHSNAGTIELSLTADGELMVSDDGCGFPHDLMTTRVGLLRVRYWARRGSLRVRLRTSPESGTIFRVTQSHAI